MKTIKINISDIIYSQRIDVAYFKNNLGLNSYVSLSEYVNIKGGKRIPKGSTFSEEKTDYLYLRLSDIDDFENIDYNSFKTISEKLFNTLKRYEIKNNQIVFSIAGTIGKVFVLKNIPTNKRVILTENCAMLLPKSNNILPEYLSILLNCSFVQKQIEQNRIQTTIPKIGLDRIAKIKIPNVPTIVTQQKIVDIYLKAQKERLNKKQEAKSIVNTIDAFIIKDLGISFSHDIKKISSYKLSISSILGERYDTYYHQPYFEEAFSKLSSSQYPTKSLRDISLVITSGITPKSGGSDYSNQTEGIPFIRSGDIDINGDIDFDNLLYITQSIHNTKMKSSKVMKNDIMIAIVGATIGQIGIYLSDREANINQAIALVRLKTGINPEYVKEILQSSIGQINLDRLKRPVARANINLEEVASIMIPIPDINKQNEIVNKIKAIRLQAKQLHQEGDALLEETKKQIEKMIIG